MNRNLLICFFLMLLHIVADARQHPNLTITSSGVKHICAEIDNVPFFKTVVIEAQKEVNKYDYTVMRSEHSVSTTRILAQAKKEYDLDKQHNIIIDEEKIKWKGPYQLIKIKI